VRRAFKSFPPELLCPLCGMNTDSECVLAGIDGTEDGMNEQATPVHVDCLLEMVRHNKNVGVLYARTIEAEVKQ